MAHPLDDTDRSILRTLRRHPRASITEIARRAGFARGTVYGRLERLERDGVITGWGPELDTRAAGYDVLAFLWLQIAQGAHDETITALAEIDEVLEIHTITGDADLLCKVVAQSNDHLHDIVLAVTALPPVRHSQTQLALHTSHRRGLVDLF
ncbi:MAG: Lrp/AsnC family transcriptional regulator [Acidimicrobiales bacterium]|nr:Lrp/AsnC family transcriptional regulator [Acidimicrobiales bacterium]